MVYTVGEMAKKLGVAPSTLRYYDKEGLLPFVTRSKSGIRVFQERDLEWLRIIGCLKKTGMALKDIRCFVEMAMQGDTTVAPRLALIIKQRQAVQHKIAELQETLAVLEYKEWYYQTAQAAGTTRVPREMSDSELPPQLCAVRKQLKGEQNITEGRS